MTNMSLGSDNTVCANEFITAMRNRLNQLNPPQGANVDDPNVRPNLVALGQAVFEILTADAQIHSDAASDATFWVWIAAVNAWLGKLSTWQAGLTAAFSAYAPATAPEIGLRTAVLAVASPGAPPAGVPIELDGVVK